MNKIASKFAAITLLAALNAGILNIPITNAFYNDEESSNGNIFTAGALDFHLNPSADFTPLPLGKGEATSTSITLVNDGSLGFQYTASTTDMGTDIDLCNYLNLQANLNSVPIYTGPLSDFFAAAGNYADPSVWNFVVSLPGGAADSLQDKTCDFKFTFNGWQEGLLSTQGFNDIEQIDATISSGHWVAPTEPGDDNISPISDSYVDQDRPTDNEGNNHDLKVRSQSGGKNKRAFIRFNFLFPIGTTIESAALKLFLDDAPSATRTYAVARSLSSWTESGITWNNQPATSSPSTASVITGTTNDVWLSWNVTDDVSGVVAGIFPNNGWSIFDTAENSATSREGKFISRNDDGNEDKRPVLEVAFSAPPAPTTHLVVNEVYYDVGSGKGSEGTNEWVELYNPTGSDVDIKNWQICDNTSCDTLATTSPSILIPSHGFAVVTPNASTWIEWMIPADAVRVVLGSSIGGGLSDSGDAVILKNASSVKIDAMSYGSNISELSPAVPTSGEGNSLARIIKGYDADLATDWIINATPNPGTNPSGDDGVEIMRFTYAGVEIAASDVGLSPLTEQVNLQTDLSISISSELSNLTFDVLPPQNTASTTPEILLEDTASTTPEILPENFTETAPSTSSGQASTTPEIIEIEPVIIPPEPEDIIAEPVVETPAPSPSQGEGGGEVVSEPVVVTESTPVEQTPPVEPPPSE